MLAVSIIITKLKITVTTPTHDDYYTGVEWYRDALVYDPLAYGDEITVISPTYVKNKGVYENIVEFDIYNSARNKSVKDNYDITVINGTLTVNARPISVTSNSYTWTYNGGENYYDVLSFAGMDIADGQNYVIVELTKVRNVCLDVENKILIEIYDLQ